MTAQELFDICWSRLDDNANPRLWSAADLAGYTNECVEEICESPYEIIRDSLTSGVCSFVINDSTTYHSLHTSVIRVVSVRSSLRTTPLKKLAQDWLDRNQPDWQNLDRGTPYGYVEDLTTGYLYFVPRPSATNVITLSVTRYPITAVTETSLSTELEIPRKYHRKLIPGILSKAYSKNDSETKDPQKAARFAAEWANNKTNILIDITQERSISSEDAPSYDANSIYNQV